MIKILKPDCRKPGTVAYTRFNELKAFLEKAPKAGIVDVVANTGYRKVDYVWDVSHGNISDDDADAVAKIPRAVTAAKKYVPHDFGNKRRVYAVGYPDRHGTVVASGDEISEVRWDNGDTQKYYQNVHLKDVEKTDAPERKRRKGS